MSLIFSVKYEKGIRRSEEFDSSHFDNPIDWVILNLDIKNNVISIKGSESKMARNVISETVSTISPNDELVEVSKDIDIFHPKENIKLFVESSLSTPSIKNDEIKNIELKLQLITYSDTNLEGNPLISLSGEDVRPALADIIKNTSILEDSDIFEYRCNFKYEIEGLSKSAIFLKEKGIIKPTKFEKMISSSEEIQIENIMRSLFGIAK